MKLISHDSAATLLGVARDALLSNEPANTLMLGILLRLEKNPKHYGDDMPYLATVSAPDGGLAVATMTPPHKLIVYARDIDDESLRLIANDLRTSGRHVPGVLGPERVALGFARQWEATGGHFEVAMRTRVYVLRNVSATPPAPGRLVHATEEHRPLALQLATSFIREALGDHAVDDPQRVVSGALATRSLYLWADGEPVSMAARTRPTPNGTSISLVYTPQRYRNRGYATSCVAGLCRAVLESGKRFCSLFADLMNPVSNSIYRRIGFQPVCDFTDYRFDDAAARGQ
jgi:predicted GNAT family acetyltransferase